MSSVSAFQKIQTLVAALEPDVTKFGSKGNGAAGTRIRKGMQVLKTLAQEVRTEVTTEKEAKAK